MLLVVHIVSSISALFGFLADARTVVGVPSAANISAVASLPADVTALDALVASPSLLTLLLAMLLLSQAFFVSQLLS